MKTTWTLTAIAALSLGAFAQKGAGPKPAELQVLKESVGIWDAHIQVWSNGPDEPPIKFKGVETTRAYGEHWIASDFDSEFMGQTMNVHSIVGYDLDKKQLVGTVVDHGPYAASMTGTYDAKTKTVHWKTLAKDLEGKPMIQHTSVTHRSSSERVLVLKMPGAKKGTFVKFMEIKFVKRT